MFGGQLENESGTKINNERGANTERQFIKTNGKEDCEAELWADLLLLGNKERRTK